jgi:Pyruvate/2-oxoacid:ferredoxin oxidoreductase delta subunit
MGCLTSKAQYVLTLKAKPYPIDEQALAETKRCLSCGHCNLCGRCLVFCPDVSLSVNKQGTKLEVDEMHCKGCGICAYECPRRAIAMERYTWKRHLLGPKPQQRPQPWLE